jgi:hypothetical protein
VRLHCHTHHVFLEVEGARRTFHLVLNRDGASQAGRVRDCALYWSDDPRPDPLLLTTHNGRVLGPCHVVQVR